MRSIFYTIVYFLLVNAVMAQWSSDPSENTRVTHGGLLPQIISDGAGGAYIVYQDSPALLRQVWVQWLDRYGFVRFPGNGIRVSSSERNQTPSYFLVSDSSGGVIILFQDKQDAGEDAVSSVYVQRIDSTGQKLWTDTGLEIAVDASPQSACSDGNHGAIIFWAQDPDSNRVYELRAQRILADGTDAWPAEGLLITHELTSFNTSEANPAVSDGRSGAIVLYSDSSGTKLQKVSSEAEGELLWNNGIKIFPVGRQMIGDSFGGAIVAGVRREFDGVSVKFIVRAQRIDGSGQVLWGEKGTTIEDSVAQNTSTQVFIAKDQQGGIVVGLQIFDFNTGTRKRISRRVSDGGVLVWQNDTFGGPVVTDDLGNSIFLSFEQVSNSEFNFFVQRVDDSGVELWDSPVLFSKTGGSNMASDTHGGVIIYWSEIGANSRFGIFAQQINRDGNLGEVLVTSVSWPDNSFVPTRYVLHHSYPNPFNAEMLIKYEIPESTFVTLLIFDITGKEVIKLVNKNQLPGEYQVIWNGKNAKGGDVASGIYFYQLRAGSFVEIKKTLFIK